MGYKFAEDGIENDLTEKQRNLYHAFIEAGYNASIKKGLYCVDGKIHDCRMIVLGGSQIVSVFHPNGYPVENVYKNCPIKE